MGRLLPLVLGWAGLLLAAPPARAQFQLVDLSSETFNAFDVALGDLDDDGDLDVVVIAGGSGQLQARSYLTNLSGGTTSFQLVWEATRTDTRRGGALGDFDNDGDLDLVLNDFNGILLHTNDGTGRFTEAHQTADIGSPYKS